MKALDGLFMVAAIAVIAVYLLPFAFELYPKASPQTQVWMRSVAGGIIVSAGAMLAALAVMTAWFVVTAPPFIGVWLRLQLLLANALRLYAAALLVSAGLQAGHWFAFPAEILLSREAYISAVIAIFLGGVAQNINWLIEWRARRTQ